MNQPQLNTAISSLLFNPFRALFFSVLLMTSNVVFGQTGPNSILDLVEFSATPNSDNNEVTIVANPLAENYSLEVHVIPIKTTFSNPASILDLVEF